jgi:hypothetical protein
LLVISGSWLAIYYYGDDIKNLVVQSLNKQLNTQVDVKNVDISFWKSFPEASVLFEDVVIYAVDSKSDTLIAAKTIAANFNLIELYRQNYTLTGLQIEEGSCHLLVDHSGNTNYIFWENKAEDSSSSNFSIDLQKVVLKKIDFKFEQQANDVTLHFFIDEALINGNFSESIFDLTIKSTLKNSFIQNADFTFVKDRTLFIYSQGQLDSKNETIEFQDANLGIEGMNFALKGSILYGENPRLQLEMSSENTSLEKAILLLPPKIKKTFKPYKISGKTDISGSINGPLSAIEQPSYQFNFSIENGEFKDEVNNLTFAKSSLKGKVSNRAANKAETSQIELSWFSTELNKGKIEGKLSIENFIQPRYAFNGKMSVKLADAAALFKWKDLQKAEGSIDTKLHLSGSLQSTDNYTLNDWKRSSVSGDIALKDIAFYYGNGPQHFNNIRGNFKLENNNVEVKSMHASVNQSAFELKGRFNNLIGYLLEEDENIMIDAALRSSSIRLEDFLMSGQNKDTTAFQLEISPRIQLYLQTEIDHLSFKTFELDQLKGQVVVRNEQIDARNIHFESNGGQVEGDLFIREKAHHLNTYANLDFKNINIKSLFQSFNNFGQESLKSENINGKASATIDYACVWSKSLVADLSSLKIESNLFIEDGELVNYKPLENLSKFVELEELKHIRFNNLSNQILIKDRSVFIPKFDVNSSALNVLISGSHSFENEINYKFTLLLNEILGKKAKKPKSNEFGYVEDDGLGRTKLFLKMTGTVDNPKISYDKEQLKTHIKSTVDQEKANVKRLLNEEFGLFKKDSLGNKKEVPTEPEKQPFTIEWDENPEADSNSKNRTESKENLKKEEKKSKFGKFIDKIAEPNKEEYVEPYEKD